MLAKAGNNKNKLQQRVSKSFLKIHYESCFSLDAKETCFALIQNRLTKRKTIIEGTRKEEFIQDIITNKIFKILTFLQSVKL